MLMIIESYYEKGFDLQCEAKYLETSFFPDEAGNYYAGSISMCENNIIVTRPWGGEHVLPMQTKFVPLVDTVELYDGNGTTISKQIGAVHFTTDQLDFKIIPPNQRCLEPISLNPLQIQTILKKVGVEAILHNELILPRQTKPDIVHLYNFPKEQDIMKSIREGKSSFGEIGINWDPFWLPELLSKLVRVDKKGLLQGLPPLIAYCYK